MVWYETDVTNGALNYDSKNVYDKLPGKFIVDTKQKYIQSLTDYESSHMLQQCLNSDENDNMSIDSLTISFRLSFICQPFFTKFKTYGRHQNKKMFKKKWFNNNCYIRKRHMNSNIFELKVTFHKLKK